ncbi:MAG: hypothetical protein J7L16_03365 [Deltaproteobacteria bacterium]|nr:hypothetical protein [Deltaproteobacteria bacterium]
MSITQSLGKRAFSESLPGKRHRDGFNHSSWSRAPGAPENAYMPVVPRKVVPLASPYHINPEPFNP